MTISSQAYAALSDDSYKDRAVGKRKPGQEEVVSIDGVDYKILEHVNNRTTGYQGTIYQRTDSLEIVVAHRGTEQAVKDGVITDGAMVLSRVNLQAKDAIELTRRAQGYAADQASTDRGPAPKVTVTGHSLGGTLAQITAHHFDLKGETFNAFGAASLGYRIPAGGNQMINHVMAADPVSAGGTHYGQVRIYATPKEIQTLAQSGYNNNKFLDALTPDSSVLAAGRSLGSHKLGNFLDSHSVLNDPKSRQLADTNAHAIAEYRGDIHSLRSKTTILSRGPIGNAVDVIDAVRGSVKPGEPAREEQRQQQQKEQKEKTHVAPTRIDQQQHKFYPMFSSAQQGVRAQDAEAGRTSDSFSDQLAGSLAAKMHAAGGQRIDMVAMSKDASQTFAVQGQANDPAHLRVGVDTMQAMNTTLERSTERINEQTIAQSNAQSQEQQKQQNTSRNMG